MKEAVLTYNFKKNAGSQTHINIGDYVQTLAAMNVVDISDWNDVAWVERESFKSRPKNQSKKTNLKVIANGWYMHNNKSFPVNKWITPLFTSVHIDNRMKMSKRNVRTFKKFEPIGCRDIDTVKKLEGVGVQAYFSGCLTLAFPKYTKKRTKEIIFVVDNIHENMSGKSILSFEQFRNWKGYDLFLKSVHPEFKEEDLKKATFLGQLSDIELSIDEQFNIAKERLEILKKADLVVTTRIHSLMPSMALGTRAILLMQNNKDHRFKGLSNFWNYIDYTGIWSKDWKQSSEKININWEHGKIINDESFRKFIKPEVEKVKKWWRDK